MPTVELSLSDLNRLLRRDLSFDELEDKAILYVKGEVDYFDGVDLVKCDIKDTNRPDHWSVEGIARELRGYLGVEKGLPDLPIEPSGIQMNVDKKVEKVRAKTVAAVVKNLTFTDESIKQIIQLQEKIHMTYGRNRALVAIGVYDFDRLVPPIKYTTVPHDGIRFIPLDCDEEMTPGEIMEKHPKGQEYSHLIKDNDEYPLMIDSAGNALSIPPIINSVYTGKVTEETTNVFIEITGHEIDRILLALNVLAATFAERGGKVESVEVNYHDKTIITPDFTPKRYSIDPDYCRRILGLDLSNEEIAHLLERARYNAISKGDHIEVEYPSYRGDIMHQRDVIEDVAIAYDLNEMIAEPPAISTLGRESPKEVYATAVREVMVGLGFQEILTFNLTNKDNLFKKMNLPEEDICEIANPISASWVALRNWLSPSIMDFLTHNLHVELPQKVFEVGDVVVLDDTRNTLTRTTKKLACAITDSTVSYEEASSALDALMRAMDTDYSLKTVENTSFIPGRSAEIHVNGKTIGIIGEVHPRVLQNWGLEKPVVLFEVEVDTLYENSS